MRTAQQIEGDYADALGRCELCGVYTDEENLTEVSSFYKLFPDSVIVCEDCRPTV